LKFTTHNTSITHLLSEFLVKLEYNSLPKQAIEEAKLCILDTLGCILAGASIDIMPNLIKEFTQKYSSNETTMIGYGTKLSIFSAGLLHGIMGHAVEMDDVHKKAKVHPGTVVIPALLSYGEWKQSSGKEIILATVVGYEVMNRIGMGINPTTHRLQGWHATGTCGTFGSTAALAKLERFSKDQFVSALGIAGTQSSGLWAFTADGANCKMFHAGHAVTSGITAVKLVKAGMRGPSKVIEAEDGGLFKASSKDYNFDVVTEGLGENLTITQVSRKPYACCRSMHPSIEAALMIKEKHQIDVKQIKKIIVRTYKVAKVQCGFTNRPETIADARFSIPYGVAVALYDGNALIEQFTEERIKDPMVLDLAEKVEIQIDNQFDAAYPNQWGCSLEMEMASGETYVEIIEDAKGDISYPLSIHQLENKFLYLSKGTIKRSRALEIIQMVKDLENIEDIGYLIKLCIPEKS
jgi:2-methylcitrate dehydratase PrpD